MANTITLDSELDGMVQARYASLVETFGKEVADEIMGEDADIDAIQFDEEVQSVIDSEGDLL